MDKSIYILLLALFAVSFPFVDSNANTKSEILIKDDTKPDSINALILDTFIERIVDTLYTGGVSTYIINLKNNGSDKLEYKFSGDNMKSEEYENFALLFDYFDDFVDCGDLGFGDNVSEIMVEMWYKPFEDAREYGGWEFVCPDSTFMFSVGIWASRYTVKVIGTYYHYHIYPANRYVHLVLAYKDGNHNFYLNGEKLQEFNQEIHEEHIPANKILDLINKPFYIGTKDNIRHRAYGIIDEVRVWKKVKSEFEILHEMNRELSGLDPDLIGYWNFNEGKGDTTFDGSLNNHYGLLKNGVKWVKSNAPLSPFYWLETIPDSGILNPGNTKEITLKINTTNLKGGDYYTDLFIKENGTNLPIDTIPVSIHVIDAPHISASKDTIKFQDVFAGEVYSKSITITNDGYKQLTINNIETGNDDFEIDTPSFILDECKNQVINITYHPSLFSRKVNKLVIHCNDPVFSEKEIVITRGQIMVPKDELIWWILITALGLMLVFLGMIYYRYRLINKLNRELEVKVKRAVEKQQQQQQIIIHQSGIASLGELAAGISEEINQPLQNIFHAAEVQDMELNEKNPDVNQLEKMIGEQYKDITKIREVVDHIRIFSSQQKMNIIEEFCINVCIDNTILILKQQYSNNQIYLNLDLYDGLPMISGNPHKLEQALINILNNSRDAVNSKAEKAGTEYHKRILIKTFPLNGGITIQVEDNGVGIPDENMAFIFEPFFTTKESDKRIGLGLAVALEIINEMNGTIDVQSDLQSGTKICINVPVRP